MSSEVFIPFGRDRLKDAPTRLLRNGRWANALVTVVEIDGKRWTIKDFSERNWLVRNTFARFVLAREVKAVSHLDGIEGVPQKAFRIDGYALAVEFMEGRPLASVPPAEVSVGYLEQAEKLIFAIHERGIVHLDTRGTGNWVMTPQGKPALIDFQAALTTRWMPRWLRRFVERMDLGGVLKKWKQFHPNEMGAAREKANEKIGRLRKLWILRGYFGVKKNHHRK